MIQAFRRPGPLHGVLADWPFRFHITTNWDQLLESASQGRLVSLGNSPDETRKTGAGGRGYVWHVHGAARLPDDRSRLVVGDADYREFYPDSNMAVRLRALTAAHRCLYVGFGFRDPDLDLLLQAVGRHGHQGRCNYAFIGYNDDGGAERRHRDELLSKFNVKVLPYRVRDNDHTRLRKLIGAYSSFVVPCSMSFDAQQCHTPVYDPAASSLKIQSALDVGKMSASRSSLGETLLGARILAWLREGNEQTKDEVVDHFSRMGWPSDDVLACIETLRDQDAVCCGQLVRISEDYLGVSKDAEAKVELLQARFAASVAHRVIEANDGDGEDCNDRVTATLSSFFEDLCRHHGLGVAQNLAVPNDQQACLRAVALVQKLPDYLQTCRSRSEALAAVEVATEILRSPTESEAAYLGLLCQAYFGQHLVGASQQVGSVDINFINGTCFVLDASVLVCLLAAGSDAHDVTRQMVEDLLQVGAVLVTTDMFVSEVVEHANWAQDFADKFADDHPELISALRGEAGYRSNEFLNGHFLGGGDDGSLRAYLTRVLGESDAGRVDDSTLRHRLGDLGIRTFSFHEWAGYDDDCVLQRNTLQSTISDRRDRLGTFKHPRQTQAEAEVSLIVDKLRGKSFGITGVRVDDAFFVSNTRVVDDLPGISRRICLRPEGLSQWLWTAQGASEKHGELVFEQLVWVLANEGVQFVDRATIIRRFGGTFQVSKENLETYAVVRHDELTEKYGPAPAEAFTGADILELPRLSQEVHDEALRKLAQQRDQAREAAEKAREAAKTTQKERDELARYKGEKLAKRAKGRKNKGAAQSKPRKKPGRTKH